MNPERVSTDPEPPQKGGNTDDEGGWDFSAGAAVRTGAFIGQWKGVRHSPGCGGRGSQGGHLCRHNPIRWSQRSGLGAGKCANSITCQDPLGELFSARSPKDL